MSRITLNVELSPAMDERLGELSAQLQTSRVGLFRKAIALLDIAARAKAEGLRLGLAHAHDALATEIVGL